MCLCLVLKTCFKLSVSVHNMNEASECAWSSLDRSLWGAPDHRGEPCLPACTYTPAAAWKWCKPGDAQEVFSQIHKTGRHREVQTLPKRHLNIICQLILIQVTSPQPQDITEYSSIRWPFCVWPYLSSSCLVSSMKSTFICACLAIHSFSYSESNSADKSLVTIGVWMTSEWLTYEVYVHI